MTSQNTFTALNYSSSYDMFISSENFALAWERVRYSDRLDSRDWIGLKVFAANSDHNLEILRQSVIEGTFEPSYPEVKYLPKASQTLRPIAILATTDRVVYQAIANVIAEFGRRALSTVANRQSFANVLNNPGKKLMFVNWKVQYIQHFQKQFGSLIEDEQNTWIAETDIAAFYETIDHDKLFELLLQNNFLNERILEEHLRMYLPVWASVKTGTRSSRGIPQGSLASDLLANIFLYEFDADLAIQEYHYLRYVDDIRLLAKDKPSVQRGLIHIDKNLKALGLLIQTKKTVVREVEDLDDELDRMASLLSDIDRRLKQPSDVPDTGNTDPLADPLVRDIALFGEKLDTKPRTE